MQQNQRMYRQHLSYTMQCSDMCMSE